MCADDHLRRVGRLRLGSARVSRPGRAVPARRTFLAVFIVLCPDPWVIFVLSRDSRIPWVPRDIMKFLLQVAIRSHVTIKPFLLPNRFTLSFDFIDLVRGERLYRVQQFT